MLDGRHTGTGGGNHIVLGGADARRQPVPAPARSAAQPGRLLAQPSVAVVPVLRPVHRPDQPGAARRRGAQRHALRAGDRLQPDPRSRAKAGAALAGGPHLPQPADRCRPATRTAPSSASTSSIRPTAPPAGSACVELRGFEMPPHARMSLAQQLLVRALIALVLGAALSSASSFAGAPSCTTASCCPHFVWQDFGDVLADLRERGLPCRCRVVRAAFRVPLPDLRRASTYDGIELELRQALEPWHVLGEEGAPGGHGALRRFVGRAPAGEGDGQSSARAIVTCNGRRVPLHPTGTHGESVAGVRYRAWQPPAACTRPSRRTRRWSSTSSTAGPGAPSAAAAITSRIRAGAPTTRFPVNAQEAERRRLARFETFGHTPGTDDAVTIQGRTRASRITLDLRRISFNICSPRDCSNGADRDRRIAESALRKD